MKRLFLFLMIVAIYSCNNNPTDPGSINPDTIVAPQARPDTIGIILGDSSVVKPKN